jgi:phosphotransacetylase
MQEAMKALLVRPILVGEPAEVRRAWSALRLGTPPEIVAPNSTESSLDCAVRLVREGHARTLAKGGLHTDELMRAVLRELSPDGLLSHVFVLGCGACRAEHARPAARPLHPRHPQLHAGLHVYAARLHARQRRSRRGCRARGG